MVYQNNNNRVVPKETRDTILNPQARPVDKLLKYQPDLTEYNKSKQNADNLVRLGQGLLDLDIKLQTSASADNIIEARWRTEQEGGNKQEWREVSKRLPFMAKFNPYNKDAFHKLQADDIVRTGMLKIASRPELEKTDPEAYQQFVSSVNQEMYTAFKEMGLNPKDYGDSIIKWDKDYKTIENKYIEQHADYDFNQLAVKETSDTTLQLEAALMNLEDDTMKPAVFRQVLEDKLAHLETETGIVAPDTQAKVVLGGIRNYIARNVDQIDDAEILAAVTDLKLANGKSMNEVVPNFDITIKDLMAQAREANLRQMKLEVETKDFQQQQMIREISTDFMQKYMNGELRSPDAIQAYAKEAVNKYGLDGLNSMKMFQDLASGRKTWTDLAETESDPRTVAALGMKVINGTATYEEIANAIGNGSLNAKEGLTLMQNMQSREQKIQTEENKRALKNMKAAETEFLKGQHTGDMDIPAVLIDPDDQAAFQQDMLALYNEYEQTKDYQAFNNGLALLKSSYKQAQKESENNIQVSGMARGFEKLQRTPAISDTQWAKVDINKSTKALRGMGLIRTNLMNNKDTQVTIASKPQKNRKITVTENGKTYTKNARHTGYDLSSPNLYMGKKIFPPMDNCTVVGVVPEERSGGQGNMVLLKCGNGKFIKYMHLQKADLPYLGQKLNKQQIVGHMGNSGAVGNKSVGSLHVEFYDANGEWITAWQFMEK